mmetsp:Transcript_32627/g.85726  ORF Transcript_32627/g.85726 Transcript_32627/m.85726 type:complete len:80 (+) Transcript_32627:114-353(+)
MRVNDGEPDKSAYSRTQRLNTPEAAKRRTLNCRNETHVEAQTSPATTAVTTPYCSASPRLHNAIGACLQASCSPPSPKT